MSDIKKNFVDITSPVEDTSNGQVIPMGDEKNGSESVIDEPFSSNGKVNFKTLGWIRASVLFSKINFATGVMAIPTSMYVLGAFPGAVNVICWAGLNCYTAICYGGFKKQHPQCHSAADMAGIVGGFWLKELIGFLFVITWVICAASSIIGCSTAFNALTHHSMCTNYFAIFSTLITAILSSIRKLGTLSWVTWAGFVSIFTSVLIVVITVTLTDRPAAAPKTGDFEFGWYLIGNPNFSAGIVAASTIFCASAGTNAMVPVISEMKKPKDYPKAIYLSFAIVGGSYLAFSLILYNYCGQWIATPSLGSAGGKIKIIAYGVGFLGLLVTGTLNVHISAKLIFVRILRNSKHLQGNTFIHWATWLGSVIGLSGASLILALAIPIFNYVIALAGSIGQAPLSIILPTYLWIYDHKDYRTGTLLQKFLFYFHCFLCAVGVFLCIGGTAGLIEQLVEAYRLGKIGTAFSCADNSGTIVS